jgi:hypothetical protein
MLQNWRANFLQMVTFLIRQKDVMRHKRQLKLWSFVLALAFSAPCALAQPTNLPPETNRFWFSEEFRSLVRVYGSSPLAACAAASSSLSTRAPFHSVEGQAVTCGWESVLSQAGPTVLCDPIPPMETAESAGPEDQCLSPDSLFFMARGTVNWTSSVRFKLNSSAARQAQHLTQFATTVERFYAARGWSLPADLKYRIGQGLPVEIGLNGINAKFAREVGVRPRFNLVLTFGERPPFGLSFEATEGFRPLPN